MQQMHCFNSYTVNKNISSLFLNISSMMCSARSSAGRLLHMQRPWMIKLRSAQYILVRVTISRPELADWRCQLMHVDVGLQYVWRYCGCGAMPCSHLYVRTVIFNVICCWNGSSEDHIKQVSYALIWLLQQAASFCITRSLCSSWLLTPASRLLQPSSQLQTKACTSVHVAPGVSDWLIKLSRHRRNKQDQFIQLCAAMWPDYVITTNSSKLTHVILTVTGHFTYSLVGQFAHWISQSYILIHLYSYYTCKQSAPMKD